MANVMSFKNVKNKPHRSAFDLSYKNAFTAKVGELLPCFVKEVLPGDVFHMDASHFTRTAPVNTAAFTRIRENVDFFFVPYRLIWDKWTQFIAQTDDKHYAKSPNSSADTFTSTPYFKYAKLNAMLSELKEHDGSPDSSYACLDAAGFPAYTGAIKLLQYLGYGALVYGRSTKDAGNTNQAFSLFRLGAYQKIYYDYYRNSQWESSKPYCYNLDYVFSNNQLEYDFTQVPIQTGLPYDSMLTLRYGNYSKDLTMGLNPSAQFGETTIAGPIIGSSAIINGTASGFNLKLGINPPHSTNPNAAVFLGFHPNDVSRNVRAWTDSGEHSAYVDNAGIDFSRAAGNKMTNINIPASAQSGISVLALRLAESLQKYREITLTGSKDYKDQIEKHWGVRVPDYASDLCERVFSYDSMIEISEVVSQNLSETTQNANIKGKGVSASNGKFTWKNSSNEFGILMGIYHAEPLIDYQSDLFIDRTLVNTLPSSFPIPELDSIGMEAVPRFCVFSQPRTITDATTVGYAPRYFEYKTSRDLVNGGFGSYGRLQRAGIDYPNAEFNGGWSDWVSAFGKQYGYSLAAGMVDYRSFKINPFILNSIFTSQVKSTPTYLSSADGETSYPSYESDQLLVKTFYDCKVIRNLSFDGLPY